MIFDQYQRYKTIEILVREVKKYYNIEKLNILEVGSNEQLNLEKFLPNENITYSDLIIPSNIDSDINFIQADATDLRDIKDKEFDIVISLDVYEHIPNSKRESFLNETNRVSKLLNIHCFPFESEAISSAELRANEYYKSIFGKDHIWLKEHIDNGLPNINSLTQVLNRIDKSYFMFEHGDILLWEDMMKSLFYTYYVSELAPLRDKIEEFYQQNIFTHDIGENNYRKFIIITDDLSLNAHLESCINNLFDNNLSQRYLDFLYKNIDDMQSIAQLPVHREKLENNVQSTIYLNIGNGFSEDSKIICDYKIKKSTGFIDIYADIETNVKQIRFDPIEGKACAITGLNIVSNNGELDYKLINGFRIDDYYIFANNDPQILIDLEPTSIEWLKVQATICAFEDVISIAILNKLPTIIQKDEGNILLNEELGKKEILIHDLNNNLMEKENYIEIISNQLKKYKLDCNLLISEKDELINRLDYMETSYNVMSNSTSWKITKPLRITLDLLKRIKCKIISTSENSDTLNFIYNIDSLSYKNEILNINGWIFNSNRKINNVKLLLINRNQEYRVNILNGLERNDVFNSYKNENSLYSGFSSKIKLQNVSNLSIYLEVDNKDRILINKITSSLYGKLRFYKEKLTAQNIRKICMLVKRNEIGRLKDVVKRLIIKEIDDSFNSVNIIEFEKSNIIDAMTYPVELYKYTIDIIVPVYNGYDYLKKLFDTIIQTKMNYRLIVVNDKSTDVRVEKFLKQYADINEKIILIENESNLGFVKTVNKALSISTNHIALLNTDIELPDMWLERLMMPIILEKNIASSTPFTNCGTICSFPNFCEDNAIFQQLDVETIDKAFRSIKPTYTNLPTGVGFCMGINKNVLDKIGDFDADTFDKGYGEENDWCQRAIKAGYKNVHVENLYVYHKHGGSFLSEEKKKLLERNSILLSKKHPNYNSDVANFCSIDPVKNIRNYIIFKLLSEKNEGILVYFDHNIGGGATSYLKNAVNRNISENESSIIIRYDISINGYLLKYRYKEYNLSYYCIKFDDIINVLNELKIKNIYINELVTYPNLYYVLEKIEELKNNKNNKMTMLLHDFFAICPTINLLDDSGCYCGIPNIEKCEKCLKNNESNHYFNYESIEKWRKYWGKFLNKCDEIITFSEDSKRVLKRSYDLITKISVVPHAVNYMKPINKQYKYTNKLNIGLLGTLNHHKGFDIIKEMLDLIEMSNLDINIILIGSTVGTINDKNFKQTGAYTTDMIPKLVFENDIDLFFISSICPETFSYTTQEVINMNLPIVSFDIGAPAERIKKYEKGMVLDSFDVQNALNKIIEFQKDFNYKPLLKNKKVLFIGEYISFSSRYRVEHFREQLLINGIKSDFKLIEDIKLYDADEYETVVIYRCRFNDKIDKLIKEFHENNKKVFYDIDDYIFDYDKIKNLEFLSGEDYYGFDKYSLNIFKCMQCCDGFITSTENMKQAIKSSFKNSPVCVNRNVANMEMLTVSLKARNEVVKDKDKVIIGYFSGSKTHDNDFEIVSDVLLEILKNNENVYLKIGGCLNLSKEFDQYKKQIEFFEFVDWKRLPYLIASVDINLLPVEDTFFNSCKSENKWTEAALVGVPTIASYNDELQRVIVNGESGILCTIRKEWEEHLDQLINDYSYRIRIAQRAHKVVLDKYITSTSGSDAIEFITNSF